MINLRITASSLLLVLTCFSFGFWASTPALAKENASGANVWVVDKVEVDILKSKPPKISVTATGRVQTAGWSQPHLSQIMYVMPPHDGIQVFMFYATPPSGNASQVISSISASAIMSNPPSWLRGVRIDAASNSKEALLGASRTDQKKAK